ncbi:MAG: branched-chain amino acid aminotransferase [Alphaproteobacteria bacterium]|nr:branched-chain amino acid aminotransferase [Alphaproteobacteria bacterium]
MSAAIIPFDDRDGVIWFDGKLVPWRDAKIHCLTHGLHYGSCVFEGERAYGGKIYKSEAHTDRFFKSGELMGFRIPYSREQILAAKADVVAQNGFSDAYIRPVAWRGSEMMAVSAQHSTIHVAVAAWLWPSMFDPATKMKGIKLDVSDWKRPSPESAPCHAKAAGLYMICTLSKHAAEAKGYQDALMYDYRGYVAEATGANMFFIRDGKIHTPTPDCFLNGITRQSVIDLARARQIEVIERHIMPDELGSFTEAFLCGTGAEVTPISEIGPHRYTPAALSRTLMDDYAAEVRGTRAKAA